MRNLLLGAVATAALASNPAFSAPITTNPGQLFANGTVKAVFAYKDAADTSELLRLGFGGVIFNNQSDNVGLTKTLANNVGLIEFVLNNISKGYSFTNDLADIGGDGYFHAKYGTTAADFGVTFTTAANDAIAALAPGNVTLVGFEDLRGGDYDYNDMIFAFTSIQAATVPEPASIALLGIGLLGAGALRRGRSARA